MIPSDFDLTNLLPYSLDTKLGTDLITGLREYEMLLTAFLEAVEAFAASDFHKFDPLVGENACQIRAVQVALIATRNLIRHSDLLIRLMNAKNRIQHLLKQHRLADWINEGISLQDLCGKENLIIPLTREEIFIIKCFLLSETKVTLSGSASASSVCIKEKCDPKKIKCFGNISSSFAYHLVRKLRRSIAEESVIFVREKAKESENLHLERMLSEEFTILHNNHLLCTPMFWTYQSILQTIHNERIPLIISVKILQQEGNEYIAVDNDLLVFERDESNIQQLVFKEGVEKTERAAVIVQGIAISPTNKLISKKQWREAISHYTPRDIILAGAADHRQYPDKEQNERIDFLQFPEYLMYKSFAEKKGFSLKNPKTFFIQHVYASSISSALSMNLNASPH